LNSCLFYVHFGADLLTGVKAQLLILLSMVPFATIIGALALGVVLENEAAPTVSAVVLVFLNQLSVEHLFGTTTPSPSHTRANR